MGNTSISQSPDGIFDIIRQIDRGEAVNDLEAAAMEVVDAVIATQKSGKITIEIGFAYDTSTEAMKVTTNVKKSLPQKKSKAKLFFITPEGNLSVMDSRQTQMFIDQK